MKRGLFIIAMSLLMGFGFTACNKPSLTGTWIIPNLSDETGFTLEKGGKVTTHNMLNCEYNSWEKVGDQLILKGTITNPNPRDFADTLWIDELTEETLVLKDLGNYSVTYQRKTE